MSDNYPEVTTGSIAARENREAMQVERKAHSLKHMVLRSETLCKACGEVYAEPRETCECGSNNVERVHREEPAPITARVCLNCDGDGLDFDGETCEACNGHGVMITVPQNAKVSDRADEDGRS